MRKRLRKKAWKAFLAKYGMRTMSFKDMESFKPFDLMRYYNYYVDAIGSGRITMRIDGEDVTGPNVVGKVLHYVERRFHDA